MVPASCATNTGMPSAKRARISKDVKPFGEGGDTLKGIVVFVFIALLLVVMVKGCSDEPCDDVKQQFGAQSLEAQQCLANRRSSGGFYRVPGSGGGGFGGGGHK